jgi:peptidoglycan/xylan/chitin deacetylase (PgdA/CDA1 family)
MKRLILYLLVLASSVSAQQKIAWPKHKKAVIILTYDDALSSQLSTAVPQLDSAGFKATFFLTGDINAQTIPQWRALAKSGFELGNHTLYHPCSSTEDTPVTSEKYTPYTIIREIDMMNHLLYAIDGKTSRTYAYPCTETSVNGKDYVDTLKKYGLVKYARIGGGDKEAVITDFVHLDPLKVPSYRLEQGTTAENLIAFVKKVVDRGGMGILMFHGIGGNYIITSPEAHRQLLRYLRENKKDIWVTTFREAMDYAMKQQ